MAATRGTFLATLFLPFLLLVLLGVGTSCRRSADDLLVGRAPARVVGIPKAAVITDGQAAPEGDDWNAGTAAVFDHPGAFVEYDLGRTAPIGAATLQGDNNDNYVVSISDDGSAFRELWVAPPVADPGLRARTVSGLDGRARFVRLSARGGDGHFSVSELKLSSGSSIGLPAPSGGPAGVRTAFIYLVVALGVVLFGTGAGAGRGRLALVWLIAGAAAAAVALAVAAGWPLAGQEVSFIRSAAAAVVLLALVRARPGARTPAHRPSVVAACAVGAVLAFACFYNLGRPQHWHDGARRPTFVHLLDMRVYQPFAKYFPELRYDGVYLAQVLAYAEDERGAELGRALTSLDAIEVRDQRDHHMRRVGELHEQIQAVRGRFTDQRWADFKRDMVFFRAAMGPSFMTTLTDHGANATPVWVGLARIFLGHTVASEKVLTLAGLVDAALFLGMAVALAFAFGLVPMLVAMTVFGANELYMFGTNWGGATLRHDWLALIAFAVCALKARRWVLGGALIGLATMLRVVPAVGIVGVALPLLGAAAAAALRRARGQRVSLRALMDEHRDALRVLVAAAVTMALAFVASGLLYSFESWAQWWRKIVMVNADPAVNEVSLRALLAGGDLEQRALLRARWLLYLGAQVACFLVVLRAARGRAVDQALLLGLPLMLVLMHPVNYHDHFIFLLPLVIVATRGGSEGARGRDLLASAAPLLVMCVASYQLALDPDAGRRFQAMTVALFAALGWFYANVLPMRTDPPDSRVVSADSTASGASS